MSIFSDFTQCMSDLFKEETETLPEAVKTEPVKAEAEKPEAEKKGNGIKYKVTVEMLYTYEIEVEAESEEEACEKADKIDFVKWKESSIDFNDEYAEPIEQEEKKDQNL